MQFITGTRGTSVSILALGFAAIAVPATAQTAPPPASAPQDDVSGPQKPAGPEIVITGSLIKGREGAALPVSVIGLAELSERGAPSTVELIKSLPSVGATIAGDANPLGSSRAEGASSVNLRGLGNERTLVLFNGQRLAPISSGANTFVDLNGLPSDAVGRVEILKNGGAATYGSDAIAGVINLITRRDLDGFEVSGSYSYIRNTDGDGTIGLRWGKKWTGGNILLTAGYQHRSTLRAIDRDFADRPYTVNPNSWSTGSNPGTFYVGATAATSVPTVDPGCAAAGNQLTPLAALGASRICLQHYTNFQNLVDRQERWQIYGELNQGFGGVELHLEGFYARTRVPEVATLPSSGPLNFPTTASTGTSAGVIAGRYYVPASNPGLIDLLGRYNAADLGLTGAQYTYAQTNGVTLLRNWSPYGIGGQPQTGRSKLDHRNYDAFRFVAGLSGKISGGIDWRVTGNFSQDTADSSGQDILVSRYELALRGLGGPNCTPGGGNAATSTPGVGPCQYLNVFSTGIAANAITGAANPGFVGHANDAALAAWVAAPDSINVRNRLYTVEGVISGEIGFIKLPGGTPSFAVGTQYRRSELLVTPDDFSNFTLNPCVDLGAPLSSCASNPNGPGSFFGANVPRKIASTVKAFYIELQLPLFTGFDAQFAARYEKHPGGETFNPNLALKWKVYGPFALRGSIGTTYRAPSQAQVDPNTRSTVASAVGLIRIPFDNSGNPNLRPEKSTNYSLGLLIDTRRLHFSLDYWRYDLKDQIVNENGPALVNTLLAGNCNNAALAELKARFTFNGNGCGVAADILRVRTFTTNGPRIRASGLDAALDWRALDLGDGSISLGFDGTYNIAFKVDANTQFGTTLLPAYDGVGFFNFQLLPRTLPHVRGQGWVNLNYKRHNLRLTTTYSGPVTDQRAGTGLATDLYAQLAGFPVGTTATGGGRIGSWTTVDLSYRYQLNKGTSFSLTANNVLDATPPLARVDVSYDAFVANPLGRVIKFGFSTKF